MITLWRGGRVICPEGRRMVPVCRGDGYLSGRKEDGTCLQRGGVSVRKGGGCYLSGRSKWKGDFITPGQMVSMRLVGRCMKLAVC
jgi:hypothetical protein